MALKVYPNGLRLSVIPKKDSRLVSVVLSITSGTQSEKNYEAGISEFLSRMLLMGTKNHSGAAELKKFASANGIVLGSDNTAENVQVFASTTNSNVDKAIDLLCEIAFESEFSVLAGDRVRNGLLADIYKLQENPAYTLDRMVNQALFYRTGLANAKFGTVTTISRMTAEDSKAFLDRVLTPKNCIISVVGDVDGDAVYEKVMKTFYARFIDGGDYKKLKFVAPIENFIGGERTKNKKLNQSRMVLAFPSISYKSNYRHVLNIVLPLVLRNIKKQLENATYYHSENITNTYFANNGKLCIETMVDYEHTKEYLDKVVAGIKDFVASDVDEDEFEIEKNSYIIKYLQENESGFDLNRAAIREVAVLKQSYNLSSELMKIELLKAKDASKVLNDIFDFSKLFIAYLGSPVKLDSLDYID